MFNFSKFRKGGLIIQYPNKYLKRRIPTTSAWGHSAPVKTLEMLPNTNFLLSGGDDATIRVWELPKLRPVKVFSNCTGLISLVKSDFSGQTIHSHSSDGKVTSWDYPSGEFLNEINEIAESLPIIDIFDDGRFLKIAPIKNKIKVWDKASWEVVREIELEMERIRTANFSPNGRRILLGDYLGNVQFYDVTLGKKMWTIEGQGKKVGCLVQPRSESEYIFGGISDSLVCWRHETGEEVWRTKSKLVHVQSIAVTADGKVLAGGGVRGLIELRNAETGALLRYLSGQSKGVTSLAFGPQSNLLARLLAGGSHDHSIYLWDVKTGTILQKQLGNNAGISSLATTGSQFIFAGRRDGLASKWDCSENCALWTTQYLENEIYCAFLSPDGRILACGSRDAVFFLDSVTGAKLNHIAPTSGDVVIGSLAFSPDSSKFALGSWEGHFQVWDYQSMRMVHSRRKSDDPLRAVLFSGSGNCFFVNSAGIMMWNTDSSKVDSLFPINAPQLRAVAISPGEELFSYGTHRQVCTFEISTQLELWETKSGPVSNNTLTYSNDGALLAAGVNDKLHVWARDGSLLASLPHNSFILSVAFSENALISGDLTGNVYVWDISGKM